MQIYQQQIDLEIRFSSILQLSATHNYYGSEPAEIFAWQPTPETLRLFEQLGLMNKKTEDKITLLHSSDKTDAFIRILNTLENPVFTFYLHQNNPFFRHFTEISIKNNTGQILYYNNIAQKKINPDEVVDLPQKDFASVSDLLPIVAGTWQVEITKKSHVLLKDFLGTTVFEQEVNQAGTLAINLNEIPAGKYTLVVDKQVVNEFVNIAPAHVGKAIAVVQIVLNAALKTQFLEAMQDRTKLPRMQYKIDFDNRKTYWRYLIVPQYISNPNQLIIDTNDKKITFTDLKPITLPNGKEGFMFETPDPLPLTKVYGHNFQLFKKAKGSSTNLFIQKLPFPTTEFIKPEKDEKGKEKYFSEMVVYV